MGVVGERQFRQAEMGGYAADERSDSAEDPGDLRRCWQPAGVEEYPGDDRDCGDDADE